MTMIDRKKFFTEVRIQMFGNRLSQQQVDGMNAILDEWEERGLTDLRWLAYMLATTKWETAHTMQPIEEYGRGRGYVYGSPDPVTGKVYYGRGFVQLTWKRNYEVMSKLLGIDLVNHPELALGLEVATQILFEGMLRAESGMGDFTGMALEDCFSATREDWTKARKIINGTDHDIEIGQLGQRFYSILQQAA